MKEASTTECRTKSGHDGRATPTASLRNRNGLRDLDAFAGEAAAIGDCLDACGARHIEGCSVDGIDVARELEGPCRPDLDQEQHHRALASGDHPRKFAEMLRAALGHREI